MKNTGTVFNIQHFSLHDGPGIRTVVFFKGCPLNCIWCHNPESKSFAPQLFFSGEKCVNCRECEAVCPNNCHIFENEHEINRENCIFCGKCVNACPTDAINLIGKQYTVAEVIADIGKDDIFFGDNGGVTFSGGEPFAQPEFLIELLKACKEKGYNTCIETSGYADENYIKEAAKHTDIFLYDCKAYDNDSHIKFTGKGNKIILNNLGVLNEIGATVILRCPIIPGCNDLTEHFENIGKLAENFGCIKSVELICYHPLGLSKLKQLGMKPDYSNETFLDKETVNEYAKTVGNFTKKTISISGE